MQPDHDAKARDKIVFYLKTCGPLTAGDLAERLGITAIAVRQHLQALEGDGFVSRTQQKGRVGRPAHLWELTPEAHRQFPDHHGDLVLGLLRTVSRVFGREGLTRVIEEWRHHEVHPTYARLLQEKQTTAERVQALASIRREQGYMAEYHERDDGSLQLIENHCPISVAACQCDELCAAELDVFSALLGSHVEVEREEHIASGDRRCRYTITPPEEEAR